LTLARQEHACASHGSCRESPTEARNRGRLACQLPLRLRAGLLDGHPEGVALGEMLLELNTRFDRASLNVEMLFLMGLQAFRGPGRPAPRQHEGARDLNPAAHTRRSILRSATE